jgi:cell division protein FtsI/penicillin-binding protein 2
VFENKLNYLTAGMALGLLLLLGRFAYMQVVAHDRYAGQSESMRTSMGLLEPQRAEIRLADGTVVARTESVWDVYLDLEAFADPRTLARRAHASPERYDGRAVSEFVTARLEPVLKTELPNPASRRRFFLLWALRGDPVARADYELCAARLCLVTGVPRADFDAQVATVWQEVNALAHDLGDIRTAPEKDVSAAWLRARPALCDTAYWDRVVRFPKSRRLEPLLVARVTWQKREAEYLQALLDNAGGDTRRLRDLCFAAMRTCRDRADALEPPADAEMEATEDPGRDEERTAWLRLADTCEAVVRGDSGRAAARLEELTAPGGAIAATGERLARLRRDVLERYGHDWDSRWAAFGLKTSPLLLMREAPRDVVEMIRINADALPGVNCVRRPARQVQFARELAHVLGACGLPDAEHLEELSQRDSFGQGLEELVEGWFDGDHEKFRAQFYPVLGRQLVGVSGVEATYDQRLAGLFGARVSGRDAAGRNRGIEFERHPQNAGPLTLTIDMDLQRDILRTVQAYEPRLAATAMQKSARMLARGKAQYDRWQKYRWTLRGAAVVLDVKTGAVLALCSFPDFDPAALAGRSPADRAYQKQLQLEQEHETERGYPWWNQKARQFNRATQGQYAPGSTFKVLTAIALLEAGVVDARTRFDELDTEVRHNGKLLGKTGHPAGPDIDVWEAIEESCNGFFYRYAQDLGATPQEAWTNLRDYTEMFGIGRAADTDLYHARRGRLPDSERVWAQNLAMLAIGQGEMVTTPVEIARLYAAIASRGRLVVPHLTHEHHTWPEQLSISDQTWEIVHQGMRRVVEGRRGTAAKYPVLRRIRCAGKTGTAENGLGTPDHAWFAGFAPYDDPQVAFVMLAANSDIYGAEVAPVIGECIERYLQRRGILPAPAVKK